METALQLAIITPIDELRNREIKSNVSELLPVVIEKVAEYKNNQYGITQEKMCKEHRATLNKFLNSIYDEIKEIERANNEPLERFEAEIHPIMEEITDAIKVLDDQLSEMEKIWITNNLENAKILYDNIIGSGEFGSWLPWEKILITKKTGRVTYENFFGNKGTWSYAEGTETDKDFDTVAKAGKRVVDVLTQFNRVAKEKLDIINDLDYPETIKFQGIGYIQNSYDPIKKGFDVEGAFKLMNDIKAMEDQKARAVEDAKRQAELEKQKAILEERRKAEEEKQKAVEEALKFKKNVNAPAPDPDEKTVTVRFECTVTAGQAKDLRMFCDSIGITLTPIK